MRVMLVTKQQKDIIFPVGQISGMCPILINVNITSGKKDI